MGPDLNGIPGSSGANFGRLCLPTITGEGNTFDSSPAPGGGCICSCIDATGTTALAAAALPSLLLLLFESFDSALSSFGNGVPAPPPLAPSLALSLAFRFFDSFRRSAARTNMAVCGGIGVGLR
eukprot:CAMPEP_0170185838 /NCGR_PEP_ID=MMETSP0040_2-20121228/37613_2 /TAXON_ID=641309 /ORGANISM="Lotharella oceanica, Strain CCMP622" /LENGTH=123 /DNA_ID=CAMNT_0010432377 /DNA_START=715 /DNA_END=1086 /DNA_ORIENTATION=-